MFHGIGGHGDANSDSYHTMHFLSEKLSLTMPSIEEHVDPHVLYMVGM